MAPVKKSAVKTVKKAASTQAPKKSIAEAKTASKQVSAKAPVPVKAKAQAAPQPVAVRAMPQAARTINPADVPFGWVPALKLWWAVMWRYVGLTLLVSFALALLSALVLDSLGLNLNPERWSVWLFQTLFGEYVGFLVLWVAVWLVVKKANFNAFSIVYTPHGATAPSTRLDSVLRLVWSLYWRFLVLRLVLLGVLYLMFKLAGLAVVPGAMVTGNVSLLYGMAAFMLAALVGYMVAQVGIMKYLASHTLYKRFTLQIRAK
jgi:hypothetical protein